MIEISCVLKDDAVEPIEESFWEWEPCPWSLVQVESDDPYTLYGYFESKEAAQEGWAWVRSKCALLPESPATKPVDEKEWQDAYKAYLKPWNCESLHWVPVWEREAYTVPNGEVAVYFDAGMAFGTGAHETTRLCAQRLLEFKQKQKQKDALQTAQVIDAGCGSGILAISAKRLGFSNVMGFDNDPDAIRISQENATFNGLDGAITFQVSDIEKGLENYKANLILANIEADVLCANSQAFINAIQPQGVLVLCGILVQEVKKVKAHFKEQLQALRQTYDFQSNTLGEWADLCIADKG